MGQKNAWVLDCSASVRRFAAEHVTRYSRRPSAPPASRPGRPVPRPRHPNAQSPGGGDGAATVQRSARLRKHLSKHSRILGQSRSHGVRPRPLAPSPIAGLGSIGEIDDPFPRPLGTWTLSRHREWTRRKNLRLCLLREPVGYGGEGGDEDLGSRDQSGSAAGRTMGRALGSARPLLGLR